VFLFGTIIEIWIETKPNKNVTMLEHQKQLLQNISKDKTLFKKELEKSINWLPIDDVLKLYLWVKEKYGVTHYLIIKDAFSLVAA
jgi:hypothetical protein